MAFFIFINDKTERLTTSFITFTSLMRLRVALITAFTILLIDQLVKIYVKTHFYLGESVDVLPGLRFHFIENRGMAFGTEIGGSGSYWGKLALSTFRIVAIGALIWYLRKLIKTQAKPLMIAAIAMIFAGALGNIIDSMFYGLIFNESGLGHENIASFMPAGGGYAPFLFGNVVDMIEFTFFPYVFNIADSAVTVGVAILILWNKSFFDAKKKVGENKTPAENVSSTTVS